MAGNGRWTCKFVIYGVSLQCSIRQVNVTAAELTALAAYEYRWSKSCPGPRLPGFSITGREVAQGQLDQLHLFLRRRFDTVLRVLQEHREKECAQRKQAKQIANTTPSRAKWNRSLAGGPQLGR